MDIRIQKPQEALEAQEVQVTKQAQGVKLQLEVEKIFQAVRKVTWLELEVE